MQDSRHRREASFPFRLSDARGSLFAQRSTDLFSCHVVQEERALSRNGVSQHLEGAGDRMGTQRDDCEATERQAAPTFPTRTHFYSEVPRVVFYQQTEEVQAGDTRRARCGQRKMSQRSMRDVKCRDDIRHKGREPLLCAKHVVGGANEPLP